jgi:hypothetical protein
MNKKVLAIQERIWYYNRGGNNIDNRICKYCSHFVNKQCKFDKVIDRQYDIQLDDLTRMIIDCKYYDGHKIPNYNTKQG